MSKAIQISEFGGPEVLRLVDVTVGDPGPGEVRVRHHACGINFIDVYQRTGLYQNPLPLTPGGEGAGVVEAVGEGVAHLGVGDRVAYAAPKPGSYSEARVLAATHVCRLPDEIDFETGAARCPAGRGGRKRRLGIVLSDSSFRAQSRNPPWRWRRSQAWIPRLRAG